MTSFAARVARTTPAAVAALAARVLPVALVVLAALAAVVPMRPAAAQDASVEATVDRNVVRMNESFTYVIRAQGETRGEPDVSPLTQDFEILSGPERRIFIDSLGLGLNNNTTRVRRQSAEWRFTLLPKKEGTITLPPVRVGAYVTNAITLDVQPAPTSADAGGANYFIELEVSPETIYVQAEAIVTVRLFVGVAADRPTLTVPAVSGGEAIVETLRDDVRFSTTRAGRVYSVHERRYAIFPQQAGTLTVGPVVFEAIVQGANRTAYTVRYPSGTVEIDVRPPVAPPSIYAGAAWLPARSLEISETWSDDLSRLTVGEPITRTIVLEAHGLLETQLPELDIPAQPGVRQYAEQPDLARDQSREGLRARRSARYAVIAQTPGTIELAGVEVPWFNVKTGRWEAAKLARRTLEVQPAPDAAVVAPPPETLPDTATAEPAAAPPPSPSYWPYVSLVLALGWAATLVLWLRAAATARALAAAVPADGGSRGQARGEPRGNVRGAVRTAVGGATAAAAAAAQPSGAHAKSERRVLRALRSACAADDAAAARTALLDWAALRYAEAPRSLGALAACVPEAVARPILELEAHLYGAVATPWQGDALAATLAALDASSRPAPRREKDPFVPLYR